MNFYVNQWVVQSVIVKNDLSHFIKVQADGHSKTQRYSVCYETIILVWVPKEWID